MFGGWALMLDGHMACGMIGDELLARVGAEAYEDALDLPHVRPMDFTGRPMTGFVIVDRAGIEDDAKLKAWVERGADFVDVAAAQDAQAPLDYSSCGAGTQAFAYAAWSGVSSSICTPSASSFSRATSRSSAAGNACTPGPRSPSARTRSSTASACVANDRSITAAGWPSAGGEVDDAAAREQVDPAPAELELLDERAHLAPRRRRARSSARQVDLDVEVAGVGEDRAVLHPLEVLGGEHGACCR